MRNKLLIWLFILATPIMAWAAESTDAASDSTVVPDTVSTKPHIGPLGMDDLTGMSLYLVALLLLMLSLYLWRRSLLARRRAA